MKHATKEIFKGILFVGGLLVFMKLVTMVPSYLSSFVASVKGAAQAASSVVGGSYSGGTTGTSYTGTGLDGVGDTDSGGGGGNGGFSPMQFKGDKGQL